MNDPGSPRPPRALPLGLLGVVFIVATVESVVARHDTELATVSALNWRSAEALARRVRRCEVVCVGSSLTTNGVLPRVLEHQLGKPVCNLAVFGGTAASSYFLLKRALDSGAHPRVVVLDCQDGPVDRDDAWKSLDLWKLVRLWPEALTLPECVDLSWTARDASFLAAMVVSKALPSARARFEIRARVLASLQGHPDDSPYSMAGHHRNWRMHRGAQALPARGRDDEGTRPLPRYPGPRERWVCDPVSQTYRRRLLELLRRRGIAVFWTFPPIGPRYTAWREQNGLNAYETRHAQEAQARTPALSLIDGRRSRYPARVFAEDGLHLGLPGAVAYTRDLASIFAAHLQSPAAVPRSIVLPAYRDAAITLPLETVDESTRVIAVEMISRDRRRTMR